MIFPLFHSFSLFYFHLSTDHVEEPYQNSGQEGNLASWLEWFYSRLRSNSIDEQVFLSQISWSDEKTSKTSTNWSISSKFLQTSTQVSDWEYGVEEFIRPNPFNSSQLIFGGEDWVNYYNFLYTLLFSLNWCSHLIHGR